jgi:hypothetical protein
MWEAAPLMRVLCYLLFLLTCCSHSKRALQQFQKTAHPPTSNSPSSIELGRHCLSPKAGRLPVRYQQPSHHRSEVIIELCVSCFHTAPARHNMPWTTWGGRSSASRKARKTMGISNWPGREDRKYLAACWATVACSLPGQNFWPKAAYMLK